MFSLSKILALIAILGAIWYGFKLVGRLDEARRRKVDRASREEPGRSDKTRAAPREDGVLDLVQDDSGNYVAKDKRDDRV